MNLIYLYEDLMYPNIDLSALGYVAIACRVAVNMGCWLKASALSAR